MLAQIFDAGIRAAYRVAYKLMRTWWFIRRPRQEGAVVAVWHGRQILLIKNSYRKCWGLPGGSCHRDEHPQVTAARELREEVGIDVAPDQLDLSTVITHRSEFRDEDLPIFELRVDQQVAFKIDNREVVWAEFVDGREALSLDLYPPIREYLEEVAERQRHKEAEA